MIGLMSGTSADGVDAAIVDFSAAGEPTLVAFETYPYGAEVRRRVLDISHAQSVDLEELVRLDFLLGELFAEAVIDIADKASVSLESIDYVGSHGQTVRHLPGAARFCGREIRGTMQIAQASVIAQRTGITTISDFRPRDIAGGGQGAPLVAFTDWMMFVDPDRTRAVQNIGGIANVTYLPAGGDVEDIIAFDTGPGNMIIDHLVFMVTDGRERMDLGGRIGAAGEVNDEMLRELMGNPYFQQGPPKTTGREMFGREFAENLLERARALGLSDSDLIATATGFTAESIADAYSRHLPKEPDEVILCGGGSKNQLLVNMLGRKLAPAKVLTTDDLGVDSEAKEAISFAMLAVLTASHRTGNAPSATGAASPVILGNITPTVRTF